MTKSSSALLSLVAAVPAAFLAYLLVMAFVNHADTMGGTLNAVVGVALLAAAAAALMPVGILLFGGPRGAARPKAAKAPKPSKKKGKDEVPEEESEDAAVGLEAAEGESLVEEEDELAAVESDAPPDEFDTDASFEEDWDETGEGASDEFEFDDALSDDELDFDFEDEDAKK